MCDQTPARRSLVELCCLKIEKSSRSCRLSFATYTVHEPVRRGLSTKFEIDRAAPQKYLPGLLANTSRRLRCPVWYGTLDNMHHRPRSSLPRQTTARCMRGRNRPCGSGKCCRGGNPLPRSSLTLASTTHSITKSNVSTTPFSAPPSPGTADAGQSSALSSRTTATWTRKLTTHLKIHLCDVFESLLCLRFSVARCESGKCHFGKEGSFLWVHL